MEPGVTERNLSEHTASAYAIPPGERVVEADFEITIGPRTIVRTVRTTVDQPAWPPAAPSC